MQLVVDNCNEAYSHVSKRSEDLGWWEKDERVFERSTESGNFIRGVM